jgi:hypothetical protein
MARQRSHSIAFKRQVAQEFIAGESLYALSKRHDISRSEGLLRCTNMTLRKVRIVSAPVYSKPPTVSISMLRLDSSACT